MRRTLLHIADEEDQLLLVANLSFSPVEQHNLAAMVENPNSRQRNSCFHNSVLGHISHVHSPELADY
jgi:hypothetical protein